MSASLASAAKSRDPSFSQRRSPRVLVDIVSHLRARGQTHDIRVINISPLGLMCRTEADVRVGERILIWLPVIRNVRAEVRWAEDGRVGVEFQEPVQLHTYEAMLSLIPPRQTAW